MSFTSTSSEVPFRTVITGPAESAPNRAVAKPREETTNDRTFITLIAFPPIYQLKIGSQLERRTRGNGVRANGRKGRSRPAGGALLGASGGAASDSPPASVSFV